MSIPDRPWTRIEQYLEAIYNKTGGASGGADLSTLETLVGQVKAELQSVNEKLTTANTTLASIDSNLVDGENEEY